MASEPLDPPYIRTEYKLEAVFKHRKGGQTVFPDIVAISATFALNAIPSATLEVASGLEVKKEKRATIHDVIDKLEPRDRCIVYLTVKSTDGYLKKPITSGIKDGKYIIFDGYYAGIGYQRSYNQCVYTISLVHWLDDLNCSSMLSGDWAQNTPHDLAQVASMIAASDLTGGGGASVLPGNMQRGGEGTRAAPLVDSDYPGGDKVIVTPTNMQEDLWEKVIKRIFEAICKLRHPTAQCSGPIPSPPDPPPDPPPPKDGEPAGKKGETLLKPKLNNEAAWQALRRMPGIVPPKYKAILPLNLKGFEGGEPFTYMALSAHDGLSRLIMDGMGYNSFWSKLVGDLAPSFLFAISPCAEFAQAIPFFPGLHTPHVTIEGDEYNYASFTINCAHMLSGITIYWPAQTDGSQPELGGPLAPLHGFCYAAGIYPPEPPDYEHHWGTILVRDPPAWLANPVYVLGYTRESHLNTMGRSPLSPQKGSKPNPEAPEDHRKIEQHYKDTKDKVDNKDLNVYDRFACHWYKSAILGQRHGELSGKLRFDIAPGSIVEVLPPVSAIGKENTPMFGAVVQVSFVINAEQHTAGTSFTLSHVRTKEENNINNKDSLTHYVGTVAPIYLKKPPGSPWKGGPLVVGQEPD